MMMLGVRSPQSIACGVGASISKIKLYNSDRIVSVVYVLYGYYYCYSLLSTICMKLDPSIHIGMHLVCFSKTRCDNLTRTRLISKHLTRLISHMNTTQNHKNTFQSHNLIMLQSQSHNASHKLMIT
jgi:hypothetical protein